MSVAAFQGLIDDLSVYFDISAKIGGQVAEQANLFKQALQKEHAFLQHAVTTKKPSETELQSKLAPISELMGKVGEVESKYRGKDHVNHLKAVSEGVQALGWICVEPTPGPFVKETIGSSQFWSNKILTVFKGKDETQVNWVTNFTEFLQNLHKYILQYHTTGVAWNSGGGQSAGPVAHASAGGGASESEFEALIQEHIVPFVASSEKIGGEVANIAKLFKQAVELELNLIKKAATQKKPSEEEVQKLIAPISEVMGKIGDIEGKYRGKDHVNHLKTVSEGTPALGWVVVEKTPGPFVKELIGSSEFWSNKILTAFKGKDENQVGWVGHFNGFLKALVPYIMAHHATGLSWNTSRGGAVGGAPVVSGGAVGNAEKEFKNLIDEHVSVYLDESKKIGGVVLEQAEIFKKAVDAELDLIAKSATQKKPSQDELQNKLKPISELMGKVNEIESKYRGKEHVNHLKTVSEGVAALGWVCVEPTPAPFAKEVIGASEFWSNKILKDFKGKDEAQVNWVKGFNGFLKALVPYIQANHTTGLSWNTVKPGAGPAPVVQQSSGGAQKAFEDLISEFIDPYVQNSEKIGGDVAKQAKLFKEAAVKSAELIGKASKTKKPTGDAFQNHLAPVSTLMGQIGEIESKYRGKDHINHLKAVAEGTPALGWLCVEQTPGPYAKEIIGASEFWSNKILTAYKGKDEIHVNWVNSFNGFLKALPPYILSYHTTGLTWSK